MKKTFLIFAIILLCVPTVFAINNAAKTDIDFSTAVYLNGNRFGSLGLLDLNVKDDTSSFIFALNGDFAAIFKGGFGGYLHFALDVQGPVDFFLYVAAAYKVKLNNSLDFMLNAGPTMKWASNNFTLGVDVLANLEYKFTGNWFFRFSLGPEMEIFTKDKNGNKKSGFVLAMQMPMLAIGYSF